MEPSDQQEPAIQKPSRFRRVVRWGCAVLVLAVLVSIAAVCIPGRPGGRYIEPGIALINEYEYYEFRGDKLFMTSSNHLQLIATAVNNGGQWELEIGPKGELVKIQCAFLYMRVSDTNGWSATFWRYPWLTEAQTWVNSHF